MQRTEFALGLQHETNMHCINNIISKCEVYSQNSNSHEIISKHSPQAKTPTSLIYAVNANATVNASHRLMLYKSRQYDESHHCKQYGHQPRCLCIASTPLWIFPDWRSYPI